MRRWSLTVVDVISTQNLLSSLAGTTSKRGTLPGRQTAQECGVLPPLGKLHYCSTLEKIAKNADQEGPESSHKSRMEYTESNSYATPQRWNMTPLIARCLLV